MEERSESQVLYSSTPKVEIVPTGTSTPQIKKEPWGKLLTLVGYAATLGSAVPVGYCIGGINSPASYMRAWCNETLIERYDYHITSGGLDILWSTIVSIFLVGGAIGSLGGAGAADRFGRKGCFLISGLLFVLGALLFIFCRLGSSVEMLLLGRFFVGLASGLTTASLPMYLTECAPLALRGTLGVMCAVGINAGVVVGQLFSLRYIFGTADHWHYGLSFYIVFILVCYLPSYYFPESPKWLYIVKKDRESAKRELRRLRGANHKTQIQKEIEDMEVEANAKMQTSSFGAVLCDSSLTLPLIIVCCFHGGQQLSGINAIFYYSVSIFERAGLSTTNAEWANVGAGSLNLVTSFLGPYLMANVNRRPIMQFSCFICAMFLLAFAFILRFIDYASWFAVACIVCILCYIFFYQFGLGPIPYFIGSGCFLITGFLFVLGAILFMFCRMASSVEMLLLGRLLVGLASGLTTACLPMYLAECAPLALRGTLGVFCAVGVTGGVVVGQVFSLRYVFGTADHWHYGLSFYIFLIIVCYLPSYYFPESPKWLYVVKRDRESAKRELQRLRGANQMAQIQKEMEDMEAEANAKSQTISFGAVLGDPKLLLPLVIVCAFHGGQQLTGINAIFYYSVTIFKRAGLSSTVAELANLGAGSVNLLTSLLGPYLMANFNRRTLMQFSSFVSSIFLFAFAFILHYIDYVSWFPVACIVCIFSYIFFFQLGLAPIPYFIGSEIFEVAPRPIGMAMGSLSSWSCNFIIGMLFPTLQNAWGAFVFIPFSITCILLFLLTRFYLPETRGRDPSEVAPLISKGFRSKVR